MTDFVPSLDPPLPPPPHPSSVPSAESTETKEVESLLNVKTKAPSKRRDINEKETFDPKKYVDYWSKPKDQKGDGRNSLNDKLGY